MNTENNLSKLNEHNYKISDEQFLSILAENAGLFSKTAKAIEAQFNIKYSRQAVAYRVENFPLELQQIREATLDIAEDGLLTLMKSSNEMVRLAAIKLFLTTQGRKRGYTEKAQIEITGKVEHEITTIKTVEVLPAPSAN